MNSYNWSLQNSWCSLSGFIMLFLFLPFFSKSPQTPSVDIHPLLRFLKSKLEHSNPNILDITVQFLQTLLFAPSLRLATFNHENLLLILKDILNRNSGNSQMQYQIIYCFWLMSFDDYVAGHLDLYLSFSCRFILH